MKKFILSVIGCLACSFSFSLPSFASSLSDNDISFQMDEDFVIERAIENFESVSANDFILSSDIGPTTVDTSAIEEKLDKIIYALGYIEAPSHGRTIHASFLGRWSGVFNSPGFQYDSFVQSLYSDVDQCIFKILNFCCGVFVTLILTYCLPRISKAIRKFFFLRRKTHD